MPHIYNQVKQRSPSSHLLFNLVVLGAWLLVGPWISLPLNLVVLVVQLLVGLVELLLLLLVLHLLLAAYKYNAWLLASGCVVLGLKERYLSSRVVVAAAGHATANYAANTEAQEQNGGRDRNSYDRSCAHEAASRRGGTS